MIMYRVEIISNKSVEEDITDTIDTYLPQVLYTTIPLVYGKGRDDRKMGTSTWPETNFVLVSYIEDNDYDRMKEIVRAVKERFPREGIKMFAVKTEEL